MQENLPKFEDIVMGALPHVNKYAGQLDLPSQVCMKGRQYSFLKLICGPCSGESDVEVSDVQNFHILPDLRRNVWTSFLR